MSHCCFYQLSRYFSKCLVGHEKQLDDVMCRGLELAKLKVSGTCVGFSLGRAATVRWGVVSLYTVRSHSVRRDLAVYQELKEQEQELKEQSLGGIARWLFF